MLHVTNGDCLAERLREVLPPSEDIAIWAEVLHEGTVPAEITPEIWRPIRARFYSDCGWGTSEECLSQLEAWDLSLARARDHAQVVVWVEDDLFDQLLLMRHANWFAQEQIPFFVVDVARPGQADGCRLSVDGEGDALRPYADRMRAITPAESSECEAAWPLFTSPDPMPLERQVAEGTWIQPDLHAALVRHLEEFPSVRRGLSRVEGQALATLAERGPMRFETFFEAVGAAEERPFLGDTTFLWLMEGLRGGEHPLVTLTLSGTWQLCDDGRRVLNGEADRVTLRRIDRWRGGVHLQGRHVPWRWDPDARRLVEVIS